MQRRWAAICLAFFLVTAAGAYGVQAIAQEPELEMEGETYQDNDTFERNGTTYTVQVDGGTGSLVYNETINEEDSWENNSAVEYEGGEYNVTIEPAENPTRFGLTEMFDVESILQNDSEVDNKTYTAEDGTEFVRYRDGSTEPLEEYLPDPNQVVFSEGETVEHANESKTVDNVTTESVALTWETEEEQSETLAHGENVTIDNRTYVATFPDEQTVVLSEDVRSYQEQVGHQEYFQQRLSGLNYVILFSMFSAFLIAALAFLPRRG